MTTKKKKSAEVRHHLRRQTGTNPLGVHCAADSTRGHGSIVWRHLAPWAWDSITDAHHAIVSALKRIVDAYESSYDVVRLANELLQLAAELEHIQELSGAM